MKKWLRLFLICLVSLLLSGCGTQALGGEIPGGYSEKTGEPSKEEIYSFPTEEYSFPTEEQSMEGLTETVSDAEEETNPEEPTDEKVDAWAEDGEGKTSAEAGADGEEKETEKAEAEKIETEEGEEPEEETLPEDGTYTSKDDVALYIYLYGHLPSNFLTKKEAEGLGWKGGSLESYAPGMCIGGSRFGNYEGLLPKKEGRIYTECDIDTLGADKRGAKRIVFSNDGLIYYTEDHYETFELLYGEE